MPELPDPIIREVLAPELTGQTITTVEIVRPLVVRDLTFQGFAETLVGQTFVGVQRRGKVLLFPLQSGLTMGQIYLTTNLQAIPGWTGMGPEPFNLTLEDFRGRNLLRRPAAPLSQANVAQ
ncbi:MAG: DNA-formamidopyrimidine glycosylase family protein [Anaerolineae bacterium]